MQISVLGEADARAKLAVADKVQMMVAAADGNMDHVQLVCTAYPEQVHAVDQVVSVCCALV